MVKFKCSHVLTGEELHADEVGELLEFAIEMKKARALKNNQALLAGQSLALLFDKPSLRTRFSFQVAISELGGSCIESVATTRKHEEPEDVARVLQGYCHGVVLRTHADSTLERMAKVSRIPVINGLSELHHPCQTLADLMTLKEVFGRLQGLTLTYLGDGNNILHSLMLLSPQVGLNLRFSCPEGYAPHPGITERALLKAKHYGTQIESFSTPRAAVKGVDAVYTDVWTSMGFEQEKTARESAFQGYQVNEEMMAEAQGHAVFLHCLPMERGQEVSLTLPDQPCSVIFQQSENRLHAQKALLVGLMSKGG